MNTKQYVISIGFFIFCILVTSCSPAVSTMPTATNIPSTETPISSPTTLPTPTAIPGSNNPITVGDFKFQITKAQVADTLPSIPGGAVKIEKGSLVMTANGWLPQGITSGDKLLTIITALQSDNYQSFTSTDLKITQEDSSKSAIAVLTQDTDKIVIWIYDVTPSSNSFLFVFPDGTSIDLTPLVKG